MVNQLLSPAAWFSQRKQKSSTEEWFRQRKERDPVEVVAPAPPLAQTNEKLPWWVASNKDWERIKKAKAERDIFLEKRREDPSYGMRKDPDTELKQAIRTSAVEGAKAIGKGTLKDIEIVFSPLVATIEYARHTGLGGQSWQIGLAAATREMTKPYADLMPAHEELEKDTRWIEDLKSSRRVPEILKDRGWPEWVSDYVGETAEFIPYMVTPTMAYGAMSKSGKALLRGSKLYKNLLAQAVEKGDVFTARKINQFVRSISRLKNEAEGLAAKGLTPQGTPIRPQAGLPYKKPIAPRVVHTMPDGTIMPGPEHAGAIPGSTRPAITPLEKKALSPIKTPTEAPVRPVVPPKPKGRVEEIKEFFAKQPKPSEPARELGAVDREIASSTKKLAEEQYDASVQFIRQVQEKGGIKPFAKGVEFEEYQRAVPKYLRKDKGLPPDEMADVLGLETTQGLYDRLAKLPQRMPQKDDFLESAKSLVEIYDTPLVERKQALESIIKAGLGEPAKLPISTISKRLSRVLGRDITPEQAATMMKQTDRLEAELAQVTAKWRAGLATQEQKIEALRLKGARQLTDAEYRRLMQSSTGKATMSMNARNPVTKEQAQEFVDYLKLIPELATPRQKWAIINIMGKRKLTPTQMKRLDRIFKIRTPKAPMTRAGAEDLISAAQKVPPTRGGPPTVFAELPTIPDDIYNIKELVRKPFATPTPFTFTALGPEAKKYFQYPILDAEQAAFRATNAKLIERKAITKGLGTSSSNRIGLYNLGQNPKSAAVLEKMGAEIPKGLSPKEMRASEWFKKEFDIYHTRLNQARAEIGFEPIPYEENYFTMIRKMKFMEELGWDMLVKDMPDMMAKNIHLNAPSFWATKRRLGGLKAIETDSFAIFDKYTKRANEHIHLAKPIRRGRVLLKAIKDTKPNTYATLTDYLDFTAGKPLASTGSKVLDWGLTKLRKNIAFGMLSYSLNSASVQATALVQSTAITGPVGLAEGIGKYFKDFGTRAYNSSRVLDVRSMETALTDMTEGIVGRVGKAQRAFGEVGIKPLQFIDKQTAAISWYAFESHGKKSGLTGKELIRFADEWVLKTQASAQRSVIAPIQRSQVGRTVTLFNTFVLSEWNTFWREYMGIGTRKVMSKETLRQMTNFMVGAMATNMLYEDVIGRPSPFPRPIKTLLDELKKGSSFWQIAWEEGKELATQIPVVGGSVRFESELGGAVVQTLQELVSIAAGERLRGVPALETLGKVFGIGGTSQLKKTLRGISREDRQFPFTTWERIKMVAWGSDWQKTGYLRRARWDMKNRIRDLTKKIGELGDAGKDASSVYEARGEAKDVLWAIEAELADMIRPKPEKKLSPAEWFGQRKQKLSPEEWFKQRKAK